MAHRTESPTPPLELEKGATIKKEGDVVPKLKVERDGEEGVILPQDIAKVLQKALNSNREIKITLRSKDRSSVAKLKILEALDRFSIISLTNEDSVALIRLGQKFTYEDHGPEFAQLTERALAMETVDN